MVLFSLFRFSICASLDFCILSWVTSIRVVSSCAILCVLLLSGFGVPVFIGSRASNCNWDGPCIYYCLLLVGK